MRIARYPRWKSEVDFICCSNFPFRLSFSHSLGIACFLAVAGVKSHNESVKLLNYFVARFDRGARESIFPYLEV